MLVTKFTAHSHSANGAIRRHMSIWVKVSPPSDSDSLFLARKVNAAVVPGGNQGGADDRECGTRDETHYRGTAYLS